MAVARFFCGAAPLPLAGAAGGSSLAFLLPNHEPTRVLMARSVVCDVDAPYDESSSNPSDRPLACSQSSACPRTRLGGVGQDEALGNNGQRQHEDGQSQRARHVACRLGDL